MDLKEYYNFPEGTNVEFSLVPNFFDVNPNFPCPSDMSYAMYYSTISVAPLLDTKNVTNLTFCFAYSLRLVDARNLAYWDVSNVTNLKNTFASCSSLEELDLSSWDVSNCTNMNSLFHSCKSIKSFDFLKNWDVSNCTDMGDLFYYVSVETLDLSNWNTSNVTNMKMCSSCNNLTTLSAVNCAGVNTKNNYPIYSSSNLINIGGFPGMKMSWDNLYGLAKCPSLTYESCINVLNGLYDFVGNGVSVGANQGVLKVHSNFLSLVGEEISIGTNKGWTITA